MRKTFIKASVAFWIAWGITLCVTFAPGNSNSNSNILMLLCYPFVFFILPFLCVCFTAGKTVRMSYYLLLILVSIGTGIIALIFVSIIVNLMSNSAMYVLLSALIYYTVWLICAIVIRKNKYFVVVWFGNTGANLVFISMFALLNGPI